MATAIAKPQKTQGTATAPSKSMVEGNPTTPENHQAELDAFLAAGLGLPDLGDAGRGPADSAEPVPADATPEPAEPLSDFANPAETDDLANPEDLSSLIDGDDESDETEILDDEDGDDAGDTDPEDHQPGEGNRLPKGIQKRLSKLTEQKKEFKARAESAEAEADRLKAENEALAANRVVSAPTPNDPLADVVDVSTLELRLQAARAALEWCDENVEGGVLIDAQGNETEFSMKEVAQRRRFLERLVNEHAPKRKEWIERRKEATAIAKQVYPALYREGTRMANVRSALYQQIPGLAANPDADVFVGDAVIGALVRSGQLKVFKASAKDSPAPAAKQPAAAPRTPPKATAAPAPTASPRKPEHAAILARAESGDSQAMNEALKLGLL